MNNETYLLHLLIEKHNTKVDLQELEFQLLSHPSHPSLHAFSGVLDHFSINNLIVNVPSNMETLVQLPEYFLAQIKDAKESGMVLVFRDERSLKLIYSEQKKEFIDAEEFLKKFTGIVLAIEIGEDQKGIYQSSNRKIHNAIVFTPLALIIFVFPIFNGLDFFSILHGLVSIIGLIISVAIVRHENGAETLLGNAFCGGKDEKKGCDAALTSNGATVFGVIKLSTASVMYFSGLSLAAILFWLVGEEIMPLYWISLAAIPVVFYSIYYQYFIIKSWCKLCLAIVAILVAQAGISIVNYTNPIEYFINSELLFIIGLSFFVAINLWCFLLPVLHRVVELKELKIEHYKFKRNFELFNAVFKKSSPIDTEIFDTPEILFGNPEAILKIVIITNPFCGYCKEVHELVEKIYRSHAKNVTVTIRFNISISDELSNPVRVASRLLEIYDEQAPSICINAMHDIYEDRNADGWFEKWGECKNSTPYLQILKKESEWCKAKDIHFTPQILISGRAFPKEYQRSDLIYFIEDLVEARHTEITGEFPLLEQAQ